MREELQCIENDVFSLDFLGFVKNSVVEWFKTGSKKLKENSLKSRATGLRVLS